ncbi:MAG TPA: NUDIX domain-containing protein [Terracidiphilus sp.]|jgi:predicted NUDIX family NTP pyrophosphohydrolase|nr:NUDIX domain-containing protein [Terracidiphilus sp.]
MAKRSAGILLYRLRGGGIEVLLVHPGGPFWKAKDAGAWSIPKGEYDEGDDALEAARREYAEELGIAPGIGAMLPLGEVKLASGKIVMAWALEGDCDAGAARSNSFSMEWPPRSGKMQEFPEVDQAAWFSIAEAREKMHPAQGEFLDRLTSRVRKA